MAWNEPGNGKDPWKRDDNSPNDLDQIVQSWQRRLGGLMGGSGKAPGASGGGYILIVLLLLAWAATGVAPGPEGGIAPFPGTPALQAWQTSNLSQNHQLD